MSQHSMTSAIHIGATRLLIYGNWGQRIQGPGHQWGWNAARKHGTAVVLRMWP